MRWEREEAAEQNDAATTWLSSERAARIAIIILFAGLIRTLAEVYRLNATQGDAFTLSIALRYVGGAMIAAVGLLAAVASYMWDRNRWSVIAVVLTIVLMLAWKFAFLQV